MRSLLATCLSNIALVRQRQEDYDGALDQLQKALAIQEELGDRLGIARTLANAADVQVRAHRPEKALLHQLMMFVNYNHPCGFFAQFQSIWSSQSNSGYSGSRPGDDFWQHNIAVGYRFARRRAEVQLALLNLTDQDYRLNPLNLYSELPRERTLAVSLKFNF